MYSIYAAYLKELSQCGMLMWQKILKKQTNTDGCCNKFPVCLFVAPDVRNTDQLAVCVHGSSAEFGNREILLPFMVLPNTKHENFI